MAGRKSIVIHASKLQENADSVSMLTDIEECGAPWTLKIEVSKEYGGFLSPEIADGILWLVLPVALRTGCDIISRMPVSEAFLHNVTEIFVPHLVMGDPRIQDIRIECPTAAEPYPEAWAVGTGMSLGVDSMYTAMRYLDPPEPSYKLTHFLVSAASIELVSKKAACLKEWRQVFAERLQHIENFCAEAGVPLVHVWSNYMEYARSPRDNLLHPTLNMWHVNLHNYITMGIVMGLKKMFRLFFFSSAFPYTDFTLEKNQTQDTAYYELLQMHALTVPHFFCYSGGAGLERWEKMRELIKFPLARKYLHPCFIKSKKNCTAVKCQKCLRSLFVLDYYDALDDYTEIFNIPAYKNNREKYFKELHRLRDNHYLQKLYEMMQEKYPLEMLTVRMDNAEDGAEKTQAAKEYRNVSWWLPVVRSIEANEEVFSMPVNLTKPYIKFSLNNFPPYMHIEMIRSDDSVKVAFHYESSNIKNDPELKNWVDQLGAWLVKNGFAENSFANVIGHDQVVSVEEANKTLHRLVSLVMEFAAALAFPLNLGK